VDDKKLWMLESSFKRMFISGFVAERKVLPFLIAPPVKKASLISKISHLSGNMIKSLSLDYFQDITRDSTWSLLADIEEHNQSMQEHNTSGLSKLIADVTGLKELANLPKIFSSLSCFFIDEYKDQVTVIDNQFGGIEGWLNPFCDSANFSTMSRTMLAIWDSS
jgi:hypothetical protein